MDFQILYFINQFHCEILDKIMVVITHMGTKGIFWILVGVILLLFKQTRKCGLTVLIALLFSLIIGNIPVSYTHLHQHLKIQICFLQEHKRGYL